MDSPTITDVMRAYADGTVAYAKRTIGVELDYSVESLGDVDRVLRAYAAGQPIEESSLSSAEEEDVWTFCKMIGGYVGEVILRSRGGSWSWRTLADGADGAVILCGTVRGSPPDAVWRALTARDRSMTTYYRTLLIALEGDGS